MSEQLHLFKQALPLNLYAPRPEKVPDFGMLEHILVKLGFVLQSNSQIERKDGVRETRKIYANPTEILSIYMWNIKHQVAFRWIDGRDDTKSKRVKYVPGRNRGSFSEKTAVRKIRDYLNTKRGLVFPTTITQPKPGKLISKIYFRQTDVPINKQTAIVISPGPKYLVKPEEVLSWDY